MADSSSADHDEQIDHDEKIDLDGDNDIEEMMDDEVDGPYDKDDGFRDDGFRDSRDSTEEGNDSEGERPEKRKKTSDGMGDAAITLKDEETAEQSEEDRKKWDELLALPPHGSEVFIGGLPRDISELELRELGDRHGDIFEVRIVKDKNTMESKGYAFITYMSRDSALEAVEEIHEKEFKGRNLRCSLSQSKYRLFLGNIPKSLSDEDMKKILDENGPGVENVELLKDAQNPSRNRGFVFVEYFNNACADYSRQKMCNPNFKIDGTNPTVSWADPKNTETSAAREVKAIYVKNIPENTATEKLKEIFQRHGEIAKVVLPAPKPGTKRDFGFIHFAERSSALKAVKASEKYEIDGQVLEAVLAKPQSDKRSESYKPGILPPYPQHSYGYGGDPYGAYGGGYGGGGFGQPVIYGRGPMPAGMRMVPMVLPDGRLGYVLQQPGAQSSPPPMRRHERSSDRREGERSSDGGRSRRYRPY